MLTHLGLFALTILAWAPLPMAPLAYLHPFAALAFGGALHYAGPVLEARGGSESWALNKALNIYPFIIAFQLLPILFWPADAPEAASLLYLPAAVGVFLIVVAMVKLTQGGTQQ